MPTAGVFQICVVGDRLRIVMESGQVVFSASDFLLKSIALAQICGISLAQFLRYSFNDPSGSNKKADRGLPLRSTIPSETGTTISGSR